MTKQIGKLTLEFPEAQAAGKIASKESYQERKENRVVIGRVTEKKLLTIPVSTAHDLSVLIRVETGDKRVSSQPCSL